MTLVADRHDLYRLSTASLVSTSSTAECSILSSSSGETDDDIAGPGRLLGHVYNVGGHLVEHYANKLALTLGVSPSQPSDSNDADSVRGAHMRKRARARGNPGAGRTVGRALDKVGDKIEHRINKTALRIGFGPEAAARRIRTRLDGFDTIQAKRDFLLRETLYELNSLYRDCRLLVKYSVFVGYFDNEHYGLTHYCRSDVEWNRDCALLHITELSIDEPYLRALFVRLGTQDELRKQQPCISEFCQNHHSPLLFRARRK